tara:strand:- start:10 stop:1911 length:1902 start_codon:yes stop_codon:yes gene_type:complete
MSSFNGLKRIAATSIQNTGPFILGNQLDPGTAGQVIISNGANESATWGTNSATLPNALTMGTNLSLASGNTSFDGSVADTINATGSTLTGGNGIDITGATITTDNDGTTINNTGGTGAQNQVLKVPNALTSGTNVSFSSGTTYDGSAAITINASDTDTQLNLSEGNGIEITNTGGLNRTIAAKPDEDTIDFDGDELAVQKVPNSLTAGTNVSFSSGTTYDGSSAITINTTDTDTTYQGGTGISIDTTTNPDTINCAGIPNSALSNSTISGVALGGTLANLTFFDSSGAFITSYNGTNPPRSVVLDGDTTYQGGTNITIDTTTNPDTINCAGIPNSALSNSTISGVSLGGTLANLTFFDSSGAFITSYNGTNPPRSVVLDGDTTYQGGTNITIDTTTNPDTINLNGTLTNVNLTSATNTFPLFVGGSEILKSMSYIDNSAQNFNRIFNTSNEFFFSGSQDSGTDTLEIDFTATSSTGYCEYGFYANTFTSGLVFCVGIAAATGGTSPFATTLTSSPVAIDAYKIGLFDGTTSTYSLKEILDFDGFENTYITSKFFFNNLSVGTRYRMALYGRCQSVGSLFINSGGKNTTGLASRSFHQPSFMKFYEYDSSIGGARTTGGAESESEGDGGGGDDY